MNFFAQKIFFEKKILKIIVFSFFNNIFHFVRNFFSKYKMFSKEYLRERKNSEIKIISQKTCKK